jgi:hypothetical protein
MPTAKFNTSSSVNDQYSQKGYDLAQAFGSDPRNSPGLAEDSPGSQAKTSELRKRLQDVFDMKAEKENI